MRPAEAVRAWVPRWWRGEGGRAAIPADLVLWPAEKLFRTAVAVRNRGYDAGALRVDQGPIPVISVGNLAVGGAGKTPFAAWIAGRLAEWGGRPAVVVRGYGRDEVLVHRELNPGVPVFSAARRIEGVRAAAAAGRDVAVLDDGFQHRAVARDLDIVLISADGWDGAARMLPRGPWREGIGALRRAQVVVVTRKRVDEAVSAEVERLVTGWVGGRQVVRCLLESGRMVSLRGAAGEGEGSTREPTPQTSPDILAVTSLADPRPFADGLRDAGYRVELADFPDHHEFSAAEATELARRAGERPLVMTRKEGVKLRALLSPTTEAWMVEQRVVIESGASLLDNALQRAMRR